MMIFFFFFRESLVLLNFNSNQDLRQSYFTASAEIHRDITALIYIQNSIKWLL